MITIPLLELFSGFVGKAVEMPERVVDVATQAISNAVTATTDTIAAAVTFNPLDWLIDTLFGWLPITAGGLAGIVALWLARRVFQRQPATWLRWQVPQAVGLAAVAEFGDKRTRYNDGVLLVNAWASGQVARWLQAQQGYSQGVTK